LRTRMEVESYSTPGAGCVVIGSLPC